jgi:hypothetical protein
MIAPAFDIDKMPAVMIISEEEEGVMDLLDVGGTGVEGRIEGMDKVIG